MFKMNVAKKKKAKSSSLFWRIVVSAIGAALILLAISNIALCFFGNSTNANVNKRRVGGADDNRPANQRYEWSVDYTFTDKEGKTHEGHTTRRGGDNSVTVERTVYYFPFAPFVNSLESEVRPNIGQLVYIALGVFLLLLMNSKKKKEKSRFKAVKNKNGEIDVPELNDYDDSVEEVFHDGNS